MIIKCPSCSRNYFYDTAQDVLRTPESQEIIDNSNRNLTLYICHCVDTVGVSIQSERGDTFYIPANL